MKLIDLDAEQDYLLDGKYKVKAGVAYNFVHNSMKQSLETFPDIDFARRNAVQSLAMFANSYEDEEEDNE